MTEQLHFEPGFRIPTDILLRAYREGIFPMGENADDPEIFWVRPEIRGILPLDAFHVPKSLAKKIRQGKFDIAFDTDFDAVISGCAQSREVRKTTWINGPIRQAYRELFEIGRCHTVEAWQEGKLVGGLYGVTLGRAFFGESMFSRARDASKICLAYLVEHLREKNFVLLDIQFVTEHLKQFGAVEVPRRKYEQLLAQALKDQADF